ncbi:MAG: alpha/beta fold hydrolase [Burkholderiales bacterium]
MLHAGASSAKQWNKIATLLETRYRIIAPDLWGFGATSAWSDSRQLAHDDQARLVEAVVDTAVRGPIHVVGHSYGGATAVRYALMRIPHVLSLTLSEPILMNLLKQPPHQHLFAEYYEVATAFLKSATEGVPELGWQRFLDYRNGPGTWAKLSEEAKARFIATTQDAVRGWGSNLDNPTSLTDLRGISVRTLVLRGEKTTLPDRKVTEVIRDAVPDCTYEVIPGAEHMSPLTHPVLVAAAIERNVHGAP